MQQKQARWVSDYRPLVIACAKRYAGRGAEFEDLVQEGFMALLELAPLCSDDQWLPQFLKNRLPGRVRDAAQKWWRSSGNIDIEEVEQTPHEPHGDHAHHSEEIETADLLQRNLKQEDIALFRQFLQGRSQSELARSKGVTQQAISRKISRIRKQLKPVLKAAIDG